MYLREMGCNYPKWIMPYPRFLFKLLTFVLADLKECVPLSEILLAVYELPTMHTE
jgi:hypothetical protein